MPEQDKLSIDECRHLLGNSACELTDEQVQKLRDALERVADSFYEEIARRAQTDTGVDAIRWAAFSHTCSDEELWEALGVSRTTKP